MILKVPNHLLKSLPMFLVNMPLVLPPKIVEEKKKKSESIKNKNGESKLKKVTKLQKDLMTRSGQLKVVNEEKLIKPKSESKQKIKLSSKNIISPPK